MYYVTPKGGEVFPIYYNIIIIITMTTKITMTAVTTVLPGAPTCAVLARPCKLKKMQNCPRRRDISARRGPRTRRRGIVFPPRGCLFKQLCRYLMSNSAFTFTFSAKIVILMIWDKPHIHFL